MAQLGLTAGAALVARLGQLGVDYIFANSGTDFPPIIEGLAEAAAKDMPLPQAITVPHETAAMAMAHGATLATGRAQAVMVHTNVGLANAAIGAINARADNVPMLLFSGRTPVLETGRFGARTVPIGWGQEMFDQTALVREPCKWDYELRFPEQVNDMVDRAHAIAHSAPAGPVYMALPREVLCETVASAKAPPAIAPAHSVPSAEAVEQAAHLLVSARNPVIFAQRGAGGMAGWQALDRIASHWGIPVCQYWALRLALPTDHPMAAPPDPGPLLAEADVILIIDALAPWSPDVHQPRSDATVIQLGPDPLFAQTPVRNFACDIALAGDVGAGLTALADAMQTVASEGAPGRAADLAQHHADAWRTRARLIASDTKNGHLTKRWISDAIAACARKHDATVFAELGTQLPFMRLSDPDAWFESPHSGGLGFGLPAAMGFALARPGRLVIATVGDGSYIFANPVACHQVAESLGLSLVVVVMNNAEWGAVRASVEGLYPDGFAARANSVPLTDLSPSPDFTKVAQASRAWAEKVETPDEFVRALQEAVQYANDGRRLALIDARVLRS